MDKKPRTNESKLDEEQYEIEVMMKLMLEELCTTSEAATILGVEQDFIYALIARKRISARKIGNTWIVYKPSLAKYLKTKSRRGRPSSGTQKANKGST